MTLVNQVNAKLSKDDRLGALDVLLAAWATNASTAVADAIDALDELLAQPVFAGGGSRSVSTGASFIALAAIRRAFSRLVTVIHPAKKAKTRTHAAPTLALYRAGIKKLRSTLTHSEATIEIAGKMVAV